MFRPILIFVLSLFISALTWSQNLAKEVPLAIEQTYFDLESLTDILNPSPSEEINLTIRRVEDFFASSAFAFVINPYSRFYVLPDVETVDIFQIPETRHQLLPLHEQGLSLRKIAQILTKMGAPTKCQGRSWHPEMVSRILKF